MACSLVSDLGKREGGRGSGISVIWHAMISVARQRGGEGEAQARRGLALKRGRVDGLQREGGSDVARVVEQGHLGVAIWDCKCRRMQGEVEIWAGKSGRRLRRVECPPIATMVVVSGTVSPGRGRRLRGIMADRSAYSPLTSSLSLTLIHFLIQLPV